jgi:hypothetical protein
MVSFMRSCSKDNRGFGYASKPNFSVEQRTL